MYEVPDVVLGDHLGVYLMQYRQLVSVTPEYELAELGFELMLDHEAFDSIPSSLEIRGRN